MDDEIDDMATRFASLSDSVREDIVAILRSVYGGGYVNQKRSWEEMKEQRAKSYRALMALGFEK